MPPLGQTPSRVSMALAAVAPAGAIAAAKRSLVDLPPVLASPTPSPSTSGPPSPTQQQQRRRRWTRAKAAMVSLNVFAHLHLSAPVLRAAFNILCGILGTGTLSLPFAMASIGSGAGITLLIVLTILLTYTGLMIHWCLDALPHANTFMQLGTVVAGRAGYWSVAIAQMTTLVGYGRRCGARPAAARD